MGFIPYLTKTMKAYPEIIPVVGITAFAVAMYVLVFVQAFEYEEG